MRKITENSIEKFLARRRYTSGNMSVREFGGNWLLELHGNAIAELHPDNTLTIRDCGWQTVTTKERLHGLLSRLGLGHLFQRNHEWFFEDGTGVHSWPGSMTFQLYPVRGQL